MKKYEDKPYKDLTGQTFGALVALRPTVKAQGRWQWLFQCQCGAQVAKDGRRVSHMAKSGAMVSCGCVERQRKAEAQRTHGMHKHPAYSVWASMLSRCRNPLDRAWKDYGGRGIIACQRWQESFTNFWDDMGATYQRGLAINRIDNDGPYSPENCEWTTPKLNSLNRRNSVGVDILGLSRTVGVSTTTLYYRLHRGLPLDHRNLVI